MDDTVRRILWILILAGAVSYATYLAAASALHLNESGINTPVVVRDSLTRGEHHLTGMIMVPSSCNEITLIVEKADDTTYQLTFATWPEPSVPCDNVPTPRVFNATVFAPSIGVHFIATLDKKSFPIAVYPYIETH